MDLGITNRWAIVCAASKGLGRACAAALASEGVNVVIGARGVDDLNRTAAELRRLPNAQAVIAVPGDVTTPQGREDLLAAAPVVDILVTNAGGPPTGDFRDWSLTDWHNALNGNMLTPIELIKAVVDGMIDRRFGRIINITSTAVKAPIDILGLSNGARSGLTGFVAGLARSTVRHNVTINNLLPGFFDTDRIANNFMDIANLTGRSVEEVRQNKKAEIPANRFGSPDELGAACAYLCSAQAGFITGQNLLIDGGAYPGTF